MKKKFFATILVILLMSINFACNQEGDENIYNKSCCDNQTGINFTKGTDSLSGLILWDDDLNVKLMSIDITCEETSTCTVYEMTFSAKSSIPVYFSDFWLEDENNNIVSEVVSPSWQPEIEFIFSSNLEITDSKKIYLVSLLDDASSPGSGATNTFEPSLQKVDASETVIGLPLQGNSIYAEYEYEDIYFTYLAPSSPSGTIAEGNAVTLMTFQANTSVYTMEVNNINYWFGNFEGKLSTCTLWENGNFEQQTNNIYYNDYTNGWIINFYNWTIPMTSVPPAPSSIEYELTCNVETYSPNQTLQMAFFSFGYYNPQNGVNFVPATNNVPMLMNNTLTIP